MKKILQEVFKKWQWRPFFCALLFGGGAICGCLAVILSAAENELRWLFLLLPGAMCFAVFAGLMGNEDWI